MQDLITSHAMPTLNLSKFNPFSSPKWTPNKKEWIITEIAKIFNPTTNILKAKHYIISSDTKTVEPCPSCKIKNKKLKNLWCYFLVDKRFIHNLQIDCKRRIHTDINDIICTLQHLLPLIKPATIKRTLPRPLSAFDNLPIEK